MATELSTRPASGLRRLFDRDPFRSLQEEMDELIANFSRGWEGGDLSSGMLRPAVDISETDDSLQVCVDLPGLKPEEVHVEVRNNTLQISGERKEEREEKGKTWHRTERRIGSFSRSTMLPCAVKEDKVQAEYSNGVLHITLPKAEREKTRKIAVKAK